MPNLACRDILPKSFNMLLNESILHSKNDESKNPGDFFANFIKRCDFEGNNNFDLLICDLFLNILISKNDTIYGPYNLSADVRAITALEIFVSSYNNSHYLYTLHSDGFLNVFHCKYESSLTQEPFNFEKAVAVENIHFYNEKHSKTHLSEVCTNNENCYMREQKYYNQLKIIEHLDFNLIVIGGNDRIKFLSLNLKNNSIELLGSYNLLSTVHSLDILSNKFVLLGCSNGVVDVLQYKILYQQQSKIDEAVEDMIQSLKNEITEENLHLDETKCNLIEIEISRVNMDYDFGPPLPYFVDIISPAAVCAEKGIESEPEPESESEPSPLPKAFYFGIAWLDGRLSTAIIEERDTSKVKVSCIVDESNIPPEETIDDINEPDEGFETEKISVIKENADYNWKISSALQTHHTLFGIDYVNISLANDESENDSYRKVSYFASCAWNGTTYLIPKIYSDSQNLYSFNGNLISGNISAVKGFSIGSLPINDVLTDSFDSNNLSDNLNNLEDPNYKKITQEKLHLCYLNSLGEIICFHLKINEN